MRPDILNRLFAPITVLPGIGPKLHHLRETRQTRYAVRDYTVTVRLRDQPSTQPGALSRHSNPEQHLKHALLQLRKNDRDHPNRLTCGNFFSSPSAFVALLLWKPK